jgi:REP element-mobilizing transposase RayT
MTTLSAHKSAYLDSNLVTDIAFPTKLNRPLLSSTEVRNLVEMRLRSVAKACGATILHLELNDASVRMRVSVPPHVAPLALLTRLKSDSTRALFATFPDLKRKVSSVWSWQGFLRSAGNSHAGAVDDYLKRSKGLHVDA